MSGVGLDELVIAIASVLLLTQVFALYAVQRLRVRMADGEAVLLRIIYRFGIVVAFSQALTVVNAVARRADYNGTADLRLAIFTLVESMVSVGFLWLVWRVTHLPDHHDS